MARERSHDKTSRGATVLYEPNSPDLALQRGA
jgi:hypothetical protein